MPLFYEVGEVFPIWKPISSYQVNPHGRSCPISCDLPFFSVTPLAFLLPSAICFIVKRSKNLVRISLSLLLPVQPFWQFFRLNYWIYIMIFFNLLSQIYIKDPLSHVLCLELNGNQLSRASFPCLLSSNQGSFKF